MKDILATLKMNLLNADHVQLDNSWNFDNVISPFSRLYLILNGSATVYHHNQVFNLKKNHLYLIPSFTYGRYHCNKKLEQYYIHFMEELGTGLSAYNRFGFVYEKPASAFEISIFKRLLEINPNRGLFSIDTKTYDNPTQNEIFASLNNQLSTKNYLENQGLLKILFAGFVTENDLKKPEVVIENKKMQIIQQYIVEHLSETLTVQHLAKQCHLNADYFSRMFKAFTGVRPLAYLQNKRIERAQLLLTTTTYSLQEIADLVGLSNISYFNRLFTRMSKKTPMEYRKMHWSV